MSIVVWMLAPASSERMLRSVVELDLAGADAVVLPGEASGAPDALLVAAAAAVRTTRIGLIAAISPWTQWPFHTARALTALDALSRGRAGWWVDSGSPRAAGADDSGRWNHLDADPADRAAALADYVAAAEALWNSWDDDAMIADVRSGRYVDAARVHVPDYAGSHFRTRGPLNSPPSPQRIPPRFADAADPIAAPVADVVVVGAEDEVPAARAAGAGRVLLRVTGRAAVEPPPTEADGWAIAEVAGGSRYGHLVHETLPALVSGRAGTLRGRL